MESKRKYFAEQIIVVKKRYETVPTKQSGDEIRKYEDKNEPSRKRKEQQRSEVGAKNSQRPIPPLNLMTFRCSRPPNLLHISTTPYRCPLPSSTRQAQRPIPQLKAITVCQCPPPSYLDEVKLGDRFMESGGGIGSGVLYIAPRTPFCYPESPFSIR